MHAKKSMPAKKGEKTITYNSPPRSKFAGFLQKFILAGIFLILFLPVIGDYGDYLYPVGRELMFRGIVEILFIAYIFLIILDRKFLPKRSFILFAVISFWAVSALATIFSMQPKLSFWGDFYRGLGFFTLTHYLIFFVILTSVIKTWKEWKRFIYFAIFVSFPVALASIFMYLQRPDRAIGTLNNAVFLGAYIALIVFVTYVFAWLEKNQKLKYFLLTLFSLQIITLILTISRGALLGFMAGIAAFLIFCPAATKRKKIWIAALALMVIIFAGINFGIYMLDIDFLRNVATKGPFFSRIFVNPAEILMGRSQSWQISILAIKEKPILGFGGDNFNIPYDKYYRPGPEELELFGSWFDRVHNFVFETLATNGILGLAAYLSIWAAAFWYLFRKKNNTAATQENNTDILLKLGLLATFTAYLIQNFFNFDTIVSQIYVFFWLALLTFLAAPRIESLPEPNKPKKRYSSTNENKGLLWIAAIILIPMLIFSLKNYHINFWTDAIAHNRTERLVSQNQQKAYDEALALYDKAVNDGWSHIEHTLRHKYASTLAMYAGRIKKNDPQQAKAMINQSLALLDENFSSERYYFNRAWLLGGVVATTLVELGEPGAKQRADYYFGKALQMSPGRPGLWVEWAKTDILTRDYKSAKEKLQKAENLNPRLTEPYFYRGIVAIYEKKYDEIEPYFNTAAKMFAERGFSGFNPIDSGALWEKSDAYYAIKDFQNLTKIYNQLLKKNPDDVQLWLSLAAIYQETGQKAKAKETIEYLLRLNSELKQHPQVQEFLKKL